MGTVIFDFDSTVIRVESLEEILALKLAANPEMRERIAAITARGMEGKLDFEASLRARLEIAAPSLSEVTAFGQMGHRLVTEGMPELFEVLRSAGHHLKIVSGGLWESIVPVARHLGLVAEDVHAVRLKWTSQGSFAGTDPSDPFSRSKIEGLQPLVADWPRPIVTVGDGFTDYQTYAAGIADDFIAFTEHVSRATVVSVAPHTAGNCAQLQTLLENIYANKAFPE